MENLTSTREFHILPFSTKSDLTSVLIVIFFFLYLFGLLVNVMIIILIYFSNHLHTPMYLFLCNLSVVDICYTTVTVPKLLYLLISRIKTISYTECFIQMYCYLVVGGTEDILILLMAFDRYVAICNPLHYHRILNQRNCIFHMAGIWTVGGLNSFIVTFAASKMSFCHWKTIRQFFCDGKALLNIACAGSDYFSTVIYIEVFVFGFFPFLCILASYIKIIKIIFQMKSKEGRKKAFSTCSSHLVVIIMYYATGVSVYVMPRYSVVLEQVCTVLYTTVTPMINPLIYSLRNNDVKKALRNLMSLYKGELKTNH